MPPAAPRGSGSGIKVLLLALVVVVVGGGALLLLTRDGKANTDSPEGAVRAFFDAVEARDCEALSDVLFSSAGDEAQSLVELCTDAAAGPEDGLGATLLFSMRLDGVEVTAQDGTTAHAVVTYTSTSVAGASVAPGPAPGTPTGQEESTAEWWLERRDGRWRIDATSLFAGASTDSAQGS